MALNPVEWLHQAEYDMETADSMFSSGRYVYAIFMCHLSIEKGLKGLYHERMKALPPKSHNLVYFTEKLELDMPDALSDFVETLNNLSVPTRYPEDLQKALSEFTKTKTTDTLEKGKDTSKWIKTMFEK